MATFYGTVQGGRGKATRLGRSDLHVSAQSYAGSVIVHMHMENGVEHVIIGIGTGSTGGSEFPLYSGPVKGLFDDRINFGR
jgi:hypothetical protein